VRISGLPCFGSDDAHILERQLGGHAVALGLRFPLDSSQNCLEASLESYTLVVRLTPRLLRKELNLLAFAQADYRSGTDSQARQFIGQSTKIGRETHGRAHAWSLPEQLPHSAWSLNGCKHDKARHISSN
jgi:hypothetical protein